MIHLTGVVNQDLHGEEEIFMLQEQKEEAEEIFDHWDSFIL